MKLTDEQLEQITGGDGFPGGCPNFRKKGLPVSGDGTCPQPNEFGKHVECYYCSRKKPVKK